MKAVELTSGDLLPVSNSRLRGERSFLTRWRAGERVMNSVTRLLTTKLRLRVNSEKSAVARPWARKFLGFSFTNHKQPKKRLAPKAFARFKERVRELTRRTQGISLVRMVHELTG